MNKNRISQQTVKSTAQARPEGEVNKDKRLTGPQREKYTRMIDQFPRKSVFYFG
jgi:hypothetical protein